MQQQQHLELPITGMSCASCANRVERGLNDVDGVVATVNYATERATVDFDPAAVQPEELISAVERVGYGASAPGRGGGGRFGRTRCAAALIASAALSLPVLLLSMVAPLQFDGWQWVAFALATPVVIWGAWPFHAAAWANARHGSPRWTRSSPSAFWRRGPGRSTRCSRTRTPTSRRRPSSRPSSSPAAGSRPARSGGPATAIAALLELGAKDVALLEPDGTERRVPVERLAPGDRFVVRPGEKVATDGVVEEGPRPST